jgi:hypothetical protein
MSGEHDVFNVMLQILDDGRLTDGHGRTVDFKNTIVIMTSNIGSHRILEYRGAFEGEAYERMQQAVLAEMRRHFRPEFLNRFAIVTWGIGVGMMVASSKGADTMMVPCDILAEPGLGIILSPFRDHRHCRALR